MSSGTQVDLEWAGVDSPSANVAPGGTGAPSAPRPHGSASTKYLTDEEILGLEPLGAEDARHGDQLQRDSSGRNRPQNDEGAVVAQNTDVEATAANTTQAEVRASEGMPEWMRAVAADPRHSAEAAELWREHQEFRAAFSSPEEARAVKELLPGGVRDVRSLREATQSVERIDAALFSGDSRAQAEVVAEIARANPSAFRSMFAEAAKVLAGLDAGDWKQGAGKDSRDDDGRSRDGDDRGDRRHHSGDGNPPAGAPPPAQGANDPPRGDPDMSGGSTVTGHSFDPAAYAQFERATNEAVARDVRGSIHETLSRVMPEGVAEGAARRIGEDIFHEVHRALASDRTLSEQVAAVLRGRRFGSAEQQRVASLLAARARQLVPSVARRVIGEWTSTVLTTARNKAARQAAAASRVDIAAPGGSLDSMPLRQMSPREVNYASMSDEEILGM